jgi:hypothetical protein
MSYPLNPLNLLNPCLLSSGTECCGRRSRQTHWCETSPTRYAVQLNYDMNIYMFVFIYVNLTYYYTIYIYMCLFKPLVLYRNVDV